MPAFAQTRRYVSRFLTILALALSVHLVAQAQCVFTNNSFETGTFTGWTKYFRSQNVGDWYTYTGVTTPITNHDIAAPPDGTRAAVTDHNAPTTHELYQDVAIPAGPFATLSFFMAYNNTNGYFVTLNTLDWVNNQQVRVDLIKTTTANESIAAADVLANLYRSQPGDVLVISPSRKFTYNVSAFAGQTVRLRFAAAVGLSYFPISIDNVCLSTTAVQNTTNTPAGSAIETNLGSVTVTYPSVSVAGTTSIQQLDATAQTGPPAGDTFVGPAYDITTTATYTNPVSVCMQVPNVSDPVQFSRLRMLHKEGGVWVDLSSSAVNFTTKQVCGKVTSLSPFIVGQAAGPTSSTTNISGQVTASTGEPLGGVVMQLSGSQSLRTITRADGGYAFDVRPNGFYTVRAERGNYGFAPSERSLSPVGNVTEVSFTAIADTTATANPLDTDLFFVRQQYLDFLGREPDHSGLNYWTDKLVECGSDDNCLRRQRIGVSAAFLVESEFQLTGSYIYRLYNAGLGRRLSYAEFTADRPLVIGGANLEAARDSFADSFVARHEFQEKYAGSTTAESFVDSLLASVRNVSSVDLSAERATLIGTYQTGANQNESRRLVLRQVIEQPGFKQAIYNSSFVDMQYFGYLKRNPDEGGYRFWLSVLDQQPGNFGGMVCSFLTSAEYQKRFAALVTHNNNECGQ
jgi:hypothetical protein